MGVSISVDNSNFDRDVIETSHAKPVLVDFFATWCGPCKMLKPMLEKLAQEYDFVLAKVDIDQNPDLAQTYGVEGVPDVRIVVDGTVNEGFVGVLPEPQLRQLMAQLNLKSDLETVLETIYTEASLGNVAQAQELLEDLLQRYPDNRGLLLEAGNFYLETDQLETAERVLSPIQEHEKEYFAHAKVLKTLISFKQIARQPQGETELERAFQQAVQSALTENYEMALQGFLSILQRDRRYRNDGARKAMIAIFDILGDDHPLTKDYRKRLMLALY